MSRVTKCKCGWKLPKMVASIDTASLDAAQVAALRTCLLETLVICPKCGYQFGRKERFGDLLAMEADMARLVSPGDEPS